jgi:hypothetical protein
MKIIKLLLISILFVLPVVTHAELQATIKTNPENPAPYEPVDIILSSYSFNVDTSYISWFINDVLFISGIGIKKISLNTRGIGENVIITTKVKTGSGETMELKSQITPASLDLLWESPESYIPPFYEGKALPGEGSVIKMVAIPSFGENGKQISPNNLTYYWYINNEYIENISGYGKQSANIKLDYLNNNTEIKVSVQSIGGSIAEKTISIYPHEIMPIFYKYDELLGNDFSQLLTRRLETAKDITINISPFYLSTNNSLTNSPSYSWFLNGLPINTEDNMYTTLRPKENSLGSN